MNHNDYTDTESSATNDQEDTTDGEEQSTCTNRHSNNEVSFSRRPKREKLLGLDP